MITVPPNLTRKWKFDIRNQRCIVYRNITDLRKKLEAELKLGQ